MKKHSYTIPTDGTYTVTLPKGYTIAPTKTDREDVHRYMTAPFPLDRLKLNADGTWENTNKQTTITEPDIYAWEGVSACQHTWVDVGFQFTKIVCTKCNAEKGE